MSLILFIFGAIIGSFLNLCIYRMPRGESIVRPRSHCPRCKQTIRWYDNVPLLSYLRLRGICRYCKKKISLRYPIVELITASLFPLFVHLFGFSPTAFAFIILIAGLIIATFVDLEHQIIPDEISIGGIVVGFVISLIYPEIHGLYFIKDAAIVSGLGILVGGGAIYAMGVMGKLLFRKEAMGGGDVKLMAMIGAFTGWKWVLLIFFIAPFFGSVAGIILKIKKKAEVIPYGPYISLAAIVAIVWGDEILKWVMRGMC